MIKIGQIGLNYGYKVHIPAFLDDSRFKLVGVCSNNLKKCNEIKDKLNLDHATNDPEELFSLVDAVSLAIPPKEQAIVLPKAIERGLHVFFEKPLGYLPKDHISIKEDQALMIDFEFMEVDVWKELQEIILKNKIGTVLHAEVTWNIETYAILNDIKSWKTNSNLSGGVLNNFAPHCLHYIEALMGRISNIYLKAMNYDSDGEQVIYLYLKFASGASSSINISSNTFRGSGHSLEITGTEGTAVLKNNKESTISNFILEVFYRSGKDYRKESAIRDINNIDDRVHAVRSLVKKFGDWIETGIPTSPNIQDAVRVEALLKECFRSISLNKEIKL